MKKNKKAFTLIELIAVLVILAILALIVTPLVLNIIRKARVSADKRSIDAYGRSIELAVASYLLDTGNFPTSIDQLTIEYTGDEVVCSTTQLNSDSSVYLSGCTVGGRSVDYTYGKEQAVSYKTYEVGDTIEYKGVIFYVIADSGSTESSVTLLKAEPLESSEASAYLSSTEVASKVNTGSTYLKMAYYSAEDCVSAGDISGCSTEYEVSDVKQVVDAWSTYKLGTGTEYTARLATIDEISALGYELKSNDTSTWYEPTDSTPSWVYNSNYYYWTMSQYNDSATNVWGVSGDGRAYGGRVNNGNYVYGVVRPVITLSKSAI